MAAERKSHWEHIYETKQPGEFSWYQARPAMSLELIRAYTPEGRARILDVGGGDSLLVDELVTEERWETSVLDISGHALQRAQERLGEAAGRVQWIEADITEWTPDGVYDTWHDRAVFHFLVDEASRRAYLDALNQGLRAGGHAIIATFGPDGPDECSGLPVARYDGAALQAAASDTLELLEERMEEHHTPWDAVQAFRYFVLRKVG